MCIYIYIYIHTYKPHEPLKHSAFFLIQGRLGYGADSPLDVVS